MPAHQRGAMNPFATHDDPIPDPRLRAHVVGIEDRHEPLRRLADPMSLAFRAAAGFPLPLLPLRPEPLLSLPGWHLWSFCDLATHDLPRPLSRRRHLALLRQPRIGLGFDVLELQLLQ